VVCEWRGGVFRILSFGFRKSNVEIIGVKDLRRGWFPLEKRPTGLSLFTSKKEEVRF
jgi:hypothetical protein